MATKPRIKNVSSPVPGKGGFNIITNAPTVMSSVLNYELMVAWHSLAGPVTRNRFFNEAFDELEYNFGQYLDTKAGSNPKALQHVYEWGENGSRRLWKLKKTDVSENGFKIKFNFLQSKRVSPIDPILLEPGPSGKTVKRSAVFKNKAAVMEYGDRVTIAPKKSKYLAIPMKNVSGNSKDRGIVFSNKSVSISNVGGKDAKLSFTNSFGSWMPSRGASIIKNGKAIKKLERAAKLSGQNVPSRIKSVSVKGKVSSSEIDALAQAAVEGNWR
jgi:hypothetical protein